MVLNSFSHPQGKILCTSWARKDRMCHSPSYPATSHPGQSNYIHPLFLRLQPCSIYNPPIAFV
jgi:hypothetical protein